MNYLLIDESDPADSFECEGKVLKPFFASTKLFREKQNLELLHKGRNVENALKRNKTNYFNLVHFSAHGTYNRSTKTQLDYSVIVQRRKGKDIEIFRPDSVVRTGLMADVFLSTNCQSFNPLFVDVLKNYQGISNYIAPVNSPYIGNTLIFSMMFYNTLLRRIRKNANHISDEIAIDSFQETKRCYSKYNKEEDFRLFNVGYNKTFK